MPPLPAVPNVIKIVSSFVLVDSPGVCITHMRYSGSPPTVADLEAYLSDFAPSWGTMWAADAAIPNVMVSHECIDLSSDTGAVSIYNDTTAGTRSGDTTPASACVVVSHEISRRYRGGHPRTYLPFGTAGTYATDSSRFWATDFIAAVSTDYATFIGNAIRTSGGITVNAQVNVSYRSGGAQRTTPVVDVITSSAARDRISSQRRRLGKLLG